LERGITVISSVFVGVAGWVSGGKEERSRVKCEPRDDALDLFGVDRGDAVGESFGDSIV